ncbi:nitrite/sulfite reductase [Clostridioides sp. ES-S-0190-01]|uniref:nitrite/sulfite reductase n=1 Tax=Clostridioides sp. ES-S-0190-01 TaxID=2770787 RepID=UPI001D12730D|nr:nitrite/sulfite reductase [Clostridioides sp. ES-S-0190-01]
MDNLKETLLNELDNFKEYSLKLLNGEINKMQYKGFSGGYGVYAQRDKKSFMIRLRVSAGVLSKSQLKKIYQMATKHKLDKIHLTTRQAIQLHDLSIDSIVDIMEEGIKNDIFTRGSGGNYPRNVGLSPLSGVDPDEAFDVTPYAVATDKYFIKNATTYHLPRKLKVSYSNCYTDSAHCSIQDLGFVATLKNGKPYFRVFLGGGLGKQPKVALELDEVIKPKDALYCVEGMIKFFMAYGNYENKNKARVRYMVETLGENMFLEKFKEYYKLEKEKGNLELNVEQIDYSKPGIKIDLHDSRLIHQKQSGLYTVYIHPIGGLLSNKDLKLLLQGLDNIKNPMIRLGMTEGLYILNLDGNEAKRIIEISKTISCNSQLEQSISCIGVPICQMGIQNSQKMLHEIIDYFRLQNNEEVLSKAPKLYISGCLNSCGVHQIGSIGLCGKKKNVNGVSTDAFELFVGGSFEIGKTRLGKSLGDFKASDIPKMLYEIAEVSSENFYEWINSNDDLLNKIIDKYKI